MHSSWLLAALQRSHLPTQATSSVSALSQSGGVSVALRVEMTGGQETVKVKITLPPSMPPQQTTSRFHAARGEHWLCQSQRGRGVKLDAARKTKQLWFSKATSVTDWAENAASGALGLLVQLDKRKRKGR